MASELSRMLRILLFRIPSEGISEQPSLERL
jgi:hypothetical protein